jgi:hypothetical protein
MSGDKRNTVNLISVGGVRDCKKFEYFRDGKVFKGFDDFNKIRK